ncbi:MAG: SufE family protein [Planctomycetota bacterium]
MSNFPPTTEELFETFEDLQEWDERYDFIIDLGRELPAFPDHLQTHEHIVDGCMSSVWLVVEVDAPDQPIKIQAVSDSIIVKGLIVVMMAYFHHLNAADVVSADVSEYLAKLGLNQHLSPQRRNGLFAMIKRLRMEVTKKLAV